MSTTRTPQFPDPDFGDVPEHPSTVPMTAERWAPLIAQLRRTQPVRAELSYFTNHLWHGGDEVALSHIDGFLVVAFTDAPASIMPVAMPGAAVTPANEAALAALFQDHEVRYMSSGTALALAPIASAIAYALVEDRANADYVYRVPKLAGFTGSDLSRRRKELHRFEQRVAARARVREGRFTDPTVFDHVIASFDGWAARKFRSPQAVPADIDDERRGILAWPRDERAAHLRVFCLEVDDRPAGVSIVEPMTWGHTWMGVVFKADRSLPGSGEFLRRHVARAALRELGAQGLLNIQQDDGDPKRRYAKTSLRPLRLDKKYAAFPTLTTTTPTPA